MSTASLSREDETAQRVIWFCVLVGIFLISSQTFLKAQITGIIGEGEPAIQRSGGEEEGIVYTDPNAFPQFQPEEFEPFNQSPSETESFDPAVERGEMTGSGVGEEGEFSLPAIETPDFAELYGLSPAEAERTIFTDRPLDEFYTEVVRGSSAPDITLLGPLPEVSTEDVEFTDIAADWIYHQKSAGLTELRGHVMIIYDTTIISCDEATLDEKNEIYKFFGEGRVFVDDADFTLECDELEIHDSDAEKMIYIRGASTMLIYADTDAEAPGPDATRRDRLKYAFKQQDTTITFINGEYNYDKDIFRAHGGVKFSQPDKYAKGDEFHGENETDYMLFSGNCEFWQQDGLWLYEYGIISDDENPPSRGDKIKRALLSVPTTITADEYEMMGDNGWLQLRAFGGNVVYFKQDDKHAECELFTLWYTEKAEEDTGVGQVSVVGGEGSSFVRPPGFGELLPVTVYSPDYLPWRDQSPLSYFLNDTNAGRFQSGFFVNESIIGYMPVSGAGTESVVESDLSGYETEPLVIPGEMPESGLAEQPGALEDFLNQAGGIPGVTLEGMGPVVGGPVNIPESIEEQIPEEYKDIVDLLEGESEGESDGDVEPPGSIGQLSSYSEDVTFEDMLANYAGPREEIIMEGNVFIRQENGNWLFDYDIVSEEDETEENIEQYRKWANASCDLLHVWTRREVVEATGNVYAEQDNQNGAADFARYIDDLEMLYLRGHVAVNREDKHRLLSAEAFLFFSTKVFQALGEVQTMVMVDVEKRTGENQEGETPAEQPATEQPPEGLPPEEQPPPGQ